MNSNDANDKLLRIENKIDKMSDRIGSIDVTLASQHESLKEHIRRTELLEKVVEPIQKHVIILNGAMKLLVLIATLFTGVEGLVALMEFLRK